MEAFAKPVVILNEVEKSPSKACKCIPEIFRQAHNDKFEGFAKASNATQIFNFRQPIIKNIVLQLLMS